jgi:hypothetical protein
MPNGKPGDDWFTDIVGHGLPTFSAEADELIAEIAGADAEPRPSQLVALVDGFLEKVGHDELSSRGTATGMEYRNLRPEELHDLEQGLRDLRRSSRRGQTT